MALTLMRLVNPVAERAGLSGRDARWVLPVLDELGGVQKVRVGGLVPVTAAVEPARKARTGRRLASGEQMRIVARPAGVVVLARPLARATGVGMEGRPPARRLNAMD